MNASVYELCQDGASAFTALQNLLREMISNEIGPNSKVTIQETRQLLSKYVHRRTNLIDICIHKYMDSISGCLRHNSTHYTHFDMKNQCQLAVKFLLYKDHLMTS